MRKLLYLLVGLVLIPSVAVAAEPSGGEVQIPLDIYNQLINDTRTTRPAPSSYALGQAIVGIQVVDSDGRATANIEVDGGTPALARSTRTRSR